MSALGDMKADVAADAEAKRARRWKSEIELAGKREKNWRDEAKKIVSRYRGAERKKNSFNILWANTEILRPALYSNLPKPDVRRRFKDSDPVGKAVSEILERGLYISIDHYSADCTFKNDVLDALLCGRGISRIRYLPTIKETPAVADDEVSEDEPEPKVEEELDYEQVMVEHVDWQDFRHGDGRTWDEVPWSGFRCKLTEDEAEGKFGEDAVRGIKYSQPVIEDDDNKEVMTEVEKVAEFWEIWDKNTRTVFFINNDAQRRLYPLDTPKGEPPLDFHGFFPCPDPLRIIENTGSLIPIPIYRLYEQQAMELERITGRMNKIVDGLKLRGAYDSSLGEMADIVASEDNELTPVSKAAAWRDNGGLDKAITWVPIGPAASVLEALGKSRDTCKQIIYEITGISDIVRGASVASETATAQNLKAQYASVRLKRMQSEVQRYTRDVMCLMAEVLAEKFDQKTLQSMTGLNFPTMEQKQQAQMSMQPQPGQPPQPPNPGVQAMLQMPTWDQIMEALRNDALRSFKVDVETDSTIASTINDDMKSLSEVITALGQTMQVFTPLVQAGAMPLEAAKEIVLAVSRRAKLGMAVEDALEKMQKPPPTPPPPDSSLQVAQIKAQSDQQLAQMKQQSEQQASQLEAQLEQAKMQAQLQAEAAVAEKEAQMKAQLDAVQKQHEKEQEQARLQAESLRAAAQLETQRQIADADNATKMRIAEMQQAHDAALQEQKLAHDAQMAALMPSVETKGGDAKPAKKAVAAEPQAADYKAAESDSGGGLEELMPIVTQMAAVVGRPKIVKRDGNGNISGLEHEASSQITPPADVSELKKIMGEIASHLTKPKKIIRDADGKVIGVE